MKIARPLALDNMRPKVNEFRRKLLFVVTVSDNTDTINLDTLSVFYSQSSALSTV